MLALRNRRAMVVGLAALALLLGVACRLARIEGGAVDPEALRDGVYEGRAANGPNRAGVRVAVEDGAIVSIEVTDWFGSWKAAEVLPAVPARIVRDQSTEVDGVTGATNSSRVLMNAVEDALNQSRGSAAPSESKNREDS